jgi:hypothetical protein
VFKSQKDVYFFIAIFLVTQAVYPSFVSEKIKNLHHMETYKLKEPLKKDWTLLIYMMSDANLSHQAVTNIKQMTRVGSTESINILIQLDKENEPAIERFYILKNEVVLLEEIPQTTETIGGTSQSLYDFLAWGLKTFPSTNLAVVLWNYGVGIKEPNFMSKFLLTHKSSYCVINPKTGLYDLNRQLLSNLRNKIEKNQPSNEYNFKITNQDLADVLDKVNQEFLSNKKIDLVCIDSCFMAMIEIASQIKKSAKILVTSQDAMPSPGHNYEEILTDFSNKTLQPNEFAARIVNSFKKEYSSNYAVYTQSAMNLELINKIEQKIKLIVSDLLEAIKSEPNLVIGALKYLRNNQQFTTEFYDSDYIDLPHFFKSLISATNTLKKPRRGFNVSENFIKTLDNIKKTSQKALELLQSAVIQNATSENKHNNSGISIYFPKKNIQESYLKTKFNLATNWEMLLSVYTTSGKHIQEIKIEEPKDTVAKPSENKTKQKNKQAKSGKQDKSGKQQTNKKKK